MNYTDFAVRLFTALILGGVIGLERQWRQRMTGLRTNSLVAMGSAMFVMLARSSPASIVKASPPM